MTRLAAALALSLVAACAHPGAEPPLDEDVDAVWLDLEEAFSLLREGDERGRARARRLLASAVASFDDLASPKNADAAFAPDRLHVYRGRPHERVLAALALAALDAASGRCDLALPSLRAAELLDLRWQAPADSAEPASDAAAVWVIGARCARALGHGGADAARWREGLRAAARAGGVDDEEAARREAALVAAAEAQALVMIFRGHGPSIVLEGEHGEIASIVAGDPGAPVALDEVRCGASRGPKGSLVVAICPAGAARARPGAPVEAFSSTWQATTAQGRRFEQVLRGRARFVDEMAVAQGEARARAERGVGSGAAALEACARRGTRPTRCSEAGAPLLVGAAGLAGALTAAGARALVEPEADDRHVASLFERVDVAGAELP